MLAFAVLRTHGPLMLARPVCVCMKGISGKARGAQRQERWCTYVTALYAFCRAT